MWKSALEIWCNRESKTLRWQISNPFFQMEVTCLDENDTPPVFDESLKIVLSEAFLPGHRLAKVKATDKDLVYIQWNSLSFVIFKLVFSYEIHLHILFQEAVINYSLSLATQSFMEIQVFDAIKTAIQIYSKIPEFIMLTIQITITVKPELTTATTSE